MPVFFITVSTAQLRHPHILLSKKGSNCKISLRPFQGAEVKVILPS